jgi:hypothetical protein
MELVTICIQPCITLESGTSQNNHSSSYCLVQQVVYVDVGLQGSPEKWRQYVLPKLWYLPTSSHGATTQNNIDFFNAVRTSNRI